MRYIFVDFEMNPVSEKFPEIKKQCKREIIEIGAVMLNEEMEEVDCFKAYVRPEYNAVIGRKYRELTGISTNKVIEADTFENAYQKFLNWCDEEAYEIYAWSENDMAQVREEMELKQFCCDRKVAYMFAHWYDFQKIFCEKVNSEEAISLERALNLCGITFSGKKHDALYDARNTSRLYRENELNDIAKSVECISSYMEHEEEVHTAMGDIFDFSLLDIKYA